MKSARKNANPVHPVTILMEAGEADTGHKLDRMFALDTAMNGGIESLQLNGRSTTLDQPIPSILSSGIEVGFFMEPGFTLYLIDGEAAYDWAVRARASEDCVRLRFSVKGSARYQTDVASVDDEGTSCTFIFQPAGEALTGVYRRGVTYRGCTLYLSRSFIGERLGIADADLPAALINAWQSHEVAFGGFNLERGLLALVHRMLELAGDGCWHRLSVQAIALTLIGELFQAWPNQRRASSLLVRLRPDDRAALTRLRRAADECCPRLISVAEAVAITGLNRNKVHYGFKELFGLSLQTYCSGLRMNRAADLICNSTLPFARIAEDLGFSEATNFTAAFRLHFGVLPSQMRQTSPGEWPIVRDVSKSNLSR